VDRVARNAVDFAGPARDWWWGRGQFGPKDTRPWCWWLRDMILRGFWVLAAARRWGWVAGGKDRAAAFPLVFCCGCWAGYAFIFVTGRFALPVCPALLTAAVPPARVADLSKEA